MSAHLVFAFAPSRELLDQHADLLVEFLRDTFGAEASELDDFDLDDGTELLDFAGSWPRWMGGGASSRRGARAQWSAWIVNDIARRYGVIAQEGVRTPLINVLDAIATQRRQGASRYH